MKSWTCAGRPLLIFIKQLMHSLNWNSFNYLRNVPYRIGIFAANLCRNRTPALVEALTPRSNALEFQSMVGLLALSSNYNSLNFVGRWIYTFGYWNFFCIEKFISIYLQQYTLLKEIQDWCRPLKGAKKQTQGVHKAFIFT